MNRIRAEWFVLAGFSEQSLYYLASYVSTVIVATDGKNISPVTDGDAEPLFDLFQMLIELSAEFRESRRFIRLKRKAADVLISGVMARGVGKVLSLCFGIQSLCSAFTASGFR